MNVVGKVCLCLLLASCFSPLALSHSDSPPDPPKQRLALVIGNGAYKEAPLKNPVNDAQDMARVL